MRQGKQGPAEATERQEKNSVKYLGEIVDSDLMDYQLNSDPGSSLFFIVFVCLFKRDNAHQLTFSVYTQNVNMPELARKLIFVCSPLVGQHMIT